MKEMWLLAMIFASVPLQTISHQQATFGDVVGGGGGGSEHPDHHDPPVVEAGDALQEQQQQPEHTQPPSRGPASVEGSRAFHEHARDKDHIMKDMEGVVNKPESEMSQEELQFHYFKLHDSNNDNLLDGWELMFALNHDHNDATADKKVMSDTDISDLLDPIFREDDKDQDGFISYAEFMASIKWFVILQIKKTFQRTTLISNQIQIINECNEIESRPFASDLNTFGTHYPATFRDWGLIF